MILNDINIDTLHTLIRKSVDSSLITEEQKLLAIWMEEDAENLDTYQRLKAIYALKKLNEPEVEFNKKRKSELMAIVTKSRRRTMVMVRSVAAAVLMLCAGVGGYFLVADRDEKSEVSLNQTFEGGDGSGIRIIRNDQTIKLENNYEGDNLSYSLDNDKKELSLQQISASGGGKAEKIRIAVDRGFQYKIILPDGSTVWLNSSSEIAYSPFSDTLRLVELKGEACFDVTRDQKRPFVVKLASGNDVTVLGTLFNVKSYDDELITRIALLSGSVRVETKAGNVLLKPNKEIVIDDKSGIAEVKELANRNCIAWIDGGFIFESENFENIVRDLSRRFNIPFVIRKESIKRERLTMNIPQSTLVEVISYLKEAGRGLYSIEIKDGEVVIF